MSEQWVLNASPLIVLARVGQAHLFAALAGKVVVPRAVIAEIEAGPGDESMSAAGDFVRLEAGRSVELVVQGPATANWSYKLAEPGSYTVYAVYHAEFSEQWNRESAAGGRFENQVLFTGTAESPEVSFEIQAPKKR